MKNLYVEVVPQKPHTENGSGRDKNLGNVNFLHILMRTSGMFNSFFLAPLFSFEQQWQAQAPRVQVVAAHVVVQPFVVEGLELFTLVINSNK